MCRKDKMGTLGNIKILPVVYTKSGNGFTLPAKRHRIEHHAIPDKVRCILMKNARGDLVQYDLFILHVKRMSGIGASLEPGDHIIPGREKIHDLSFSFIAPLEA